MRGRGCSGRGDAQFPVRGDDQRSRTEVSDPCDQRREKRNQEQHDDRPGEERHDLAHDPFIEPARLRALGADGVDIETLFRESDFVSVSVPLSEATRGLVGARLLGLMKPTAYLINTARGPIVDQRALYEVLAARRIAGAGLDVFEVEPAPADEPILKLDNVIVTPHALCFTDECFAGNGAADVRGVLAVKRGEAPPGLLNRDVVETDAWRRRLAERSGAGA